MPSKREQTHKESATHHPARAAVKKTKNNPQSPPTVTSISAQKRKRSVDEQIDGPTLTLSAKKPKPPPNSASAATKPATNASKAKGSKSTLIPRGTRKKANIGRKDESLLRMVCDCSTTNRVTELHFRKIPHSMIDWNSAHHISKINAWRNQIYGRAGLKARAVSLWYEQEELWFELYFQLSIVESRKRGILLPANRQVRDAFNATFVGSVIQDKTGGELPPRAEREGNAFASKFNRMHPVLRARLNSCVFGKSGDTYLPEITFRMMERYKTMKMAMAAKGIECESEYADHLEDWQDFLAHLPDADDVEMQDLTEEREEDEDTKEMEAKEVDAVAALIRLAHSPVDSQVALSPTVGVSYQTDTTTTPELTRSTRTSFSQASGGPYTPPQLTVAFEGRASNPDGSYGCDHGVAHACEQTPVASLSIMAGDAEKTD